MSTTISVSTEISKTNSLDYPSDVFSILPEEWRDKIKQRVVLQGKHWIWQNLTKNNKGKPVFYNEGRRIVVPRFLFALVFNCEDRTKSACNVEGCVNPLCQRSSKMTPEERYAKFLTKVTAPNENGCTYYIDDKKIRTVLTDDGLDRPAHVYVCDLKHPDFLENPLLTQVGHKCKSPVDEKGRRLRNGCVTEDHLERVSAKQNCAKKEEDGTIIRGEKHWALKIPDQEIPKIVSSVETTIVLAQHYGVSTPTINAIRRGVSRVHVNTAQDADKTSIATNPRPIRPRHHLTKEDLLIAYFNLCCHHISHSSEGCIEVDLSKNLYGYPLISVAGGNRSVASLIASIKNNFTSVSQKIGLMGCHERCCIRKPGCTAFDHIRCDSPANNSADIVSEERRTKILEIFTAFQAGMSRSDIAVKFKESYETVIKICTGRRHSSITKLSTTKKCRKVPRLATTVTTETTETQFQRKLSKDNRRALEIIYSVQSGLSVEERAAKYEVTIEFLIELDKALAFSQAPLMQKSTENPKIENLSLAARQIDDEKKESSKTTKRKQPAIREILEKTKNLPKIQLSTEQVRNEQNILDKKRKKTLMADVLQKIKRRKL